MGNAQRSLFDMATLAYLKNSEWAQTKKVGTRLNGTAWEAGDKYDHKIIFVDRFNKAAIMQDYYESMENYFCLPW